MLLDLNFVTKIHYVSVGKKCAVKQIPKSQENVYTYKCVNFEENLQ